MNNRLRVFLILLGGLVVAATFTFPLWRPLLVNDVVDEILPGLNAEQQNRFEQLPADAQNMYMEMMRADSAMGLAMLQAATSPDVIVPEAEQAMPNMTNPAIVARGTFTEIDLIHKGSGTATIYQLADNSRILRFENFSVTNGPDLRVILTVRSTPRKPEEVGTDYIELGQLKGNIGNQNYAVPAEVDLNVYKGVVIYCLPFQVIFSTASLG